MARINAGTIEIPVRIKFEQDLPELLGAYRLGVKHAKDEAREMVGRLTRAGQDACDAMDEVEDDYRDGTAHALATAIEEAAPVRMTLAQAVRAADKWIDR